MWTVYCNYYTAVQNSVPTETALFHGRGSHNRLPIPIPECRNETQQILNGGCTSRESSRLFLHK